MRPLRRAKLAMLGGTRMAQSFMGSNKGEEPAINSTKVNTKQAFRRGKNVMAADQNSIEEQGSVGSAGSPAKATSIVAGSLPVIAKQPVSQQDFVDALTAVMTGKVEFSDGEGADDDDDDDGFSIKTVSTICSRVEVNAPTKTEEDNQLAVTGSQSLGIGQLFFYIDQKNPLRHLVDPLERASIPSNNQIALVPDSHGTYDVNALTPNTPSQGPLQEATSPRELEWNQTQMADESENDQYFGRSVASIRSMIEAKAKEADRDGLFDRGCEMYREGERLLYEGKIEEARDALQRAHSFQKRSLQLITSRMAETMHKQGLDHCDRGDKYLAVILLGVAEIIKHRPSAANIHMGAQVHRGYRRVCPKERTYVDARRQVDGYVKTIEKEAIPMAKTLQTYSKALAMQ